MGRGSKEGKGKDKRALRYTYRIAGLIILLFSLSTPAVYAADVSPDTITIKEAVVTRNLAESGDMLIVLHYEISWDDPTNDQPDSPVDETCMIQMLSTDESYTIAATPPYPFFNDGYGEGVASFYFTPAQIGILGINWGDPYVLRVTTQPTFTGTHAYYDHTLSDTDYSTDTTQAGNRSLLAEWIIDTAESLESDWGVSDALTTISVETVLSESGEVNFARVIPGLRDLCPDVFTVNVRIPEYDDETWTYDNQKELEDQWDNTWVEDSLEGLDELFGSSRMVGNFACIGGILGLMIVSFGAFQTTRPGMLLGLLGMPFVVQLGLMEVAVLGVITLLYVVYLAFQFFFKRG